MDNITVLVMTNGRREYLQQMFDSLSYLKGNITQAIIHDDSGDPDFTQWLHENFKQCCIYSTPRPSGFAGAMKSAWRLLNDICINDYIFHIEEDFVFIRDVPLDEMAEVLSKNDYIQQMALRRQPWNEQEARAGGIVEMNPDSYKEVDRWLEHRNFFTTNPSLYRKTLVHKNRWPNVTNSEGIFGWNLLQSDSNNRCAFWGTRDSGEWCEHIGHDRTGFGY